MISIGALVTIGQVLVLREFLVIFYGNELSIGIILAIWLLWGGTGSIVSGKICENREFRGTFFEFTALSLTILLPLTILAIRYSRIMWGIVPGEIIDPARMVQISALLLFPFCVTSGALFVLANQLAKKVFSGTPISMLYMAEAIGAGLGGIIFHFILLPNFLVLTIASITGIQLCIVSFIISRKTKEKSGVIGYLVYALLLLMLVLPLVNTHHLDLLTRKWQWPKAHVLASEDSIYNNIVVTREENQTSFFTNGLWYFSSNDKQSAEEAVHIAMLEHPSPENVLVLGSTLSGVAKEVLRYSTVKQVDLVELDPDVVHLAKKYLPADYLEVFRDSRVKLHLADARTYLTHCQPANYDVIIMIQPDPVNALISRFYTVQFFSQVKGLLRNQGVFSFRLTGAENMLGSEMATYLASIYWTARKVFPEVITIPGENTRFFCSSREGTLTIDPFVLEDRLISRHLDLIYIRPDSLQVMLNPFKIEYISSLFNELKSNVTLNYDFKPRCYFDDIVVWSKQYGQKLALSLKFISKLKLNTVFFSIILLMLAVFCVTPALVGRDSKKSSVTYLSTAVIGFSHITIEIVLILSFQVFYGFLYRQLGLLVGAFMAGLALGTLLGEKFSWAKLRKRFNLALVQMLILLILAILYVILNISQLHPMLLRQLPDWFLFPLLAALTGIVGGLQFPWASLVLTDLDVQVERAAGNLYGYDLAGSSMGCIVASIVLVPLYGILYTLLFLAILGLSTTVLIILEELIRSQN